MYDNSSIFFLFKKGPQGKNSSDSNWINVVAINILLCIYIIFFLFLCSQKWFMELTFFFAFGNLKLDLYTLEE